MKFIIFTFSILLIGCFHSHYKTESISVNYQIEIYNRYPDCRDYFLVDSSRNKVLLVSQDLEHEKVEYFIKNDSIQLIKIEFDSKNCCEKLDKDRNSIYQCKQDTVINKIIKISDFYLRK